METAKKIVGILLETNNPKTLEMKIAELSADYGVSLPIVSALAVNCENEAELEERVKNWEYSELDELPEVKRFNSLVD